MADAVEVKVSVVIAMDADEHHAEQRIAYTMSDDRSPKQQVDIITKAVLQALHDCALALVK